MMELSGKVVIVTGAGRGGSVERSRARAACAHGGVADNGTALDARGDSRRHAMAEERTPQQFAGEFPLASRQGHGTIRVGQGRPWSTRPKRRTDHLLDQVPLVLDRNAP